MKDLLVGRYTRHIFLGDAPDLRFPEHKAQFRFLPSYSANQGCRSRSRAAPNQYTQQRYPHASHAPTPVVRDCGDESAGCTSKFYALSAKSLYVSLLHHTLFRCGNLSHVQVVLWNQSVPTIFVAAATAQKTACARQAVSLSLSLRVHGWSGRGADPSAQFSLRFGIGASNAAISAVCGALPLKVSTLP
jgi:hypothetical protein